MYACVCHAVTEETVRDCAQHGLRHVVASTKAGSGCGSCVNRLRGLCDELRDELRDRLPALAGEAA